jgi:hypothetical protein
MFRIARPPAVLERRYETEDRDPFTDAETPVAFAGIDPSKLPS